jgi:hypothetical protein
MNQQIDARFADSIIMSGFTSKNALFPVPGSGTAIVFPTCGRKG